MTDVEICNLGLIKIGHTRITSLSGTDEASVYCNAVYPHIRDLMLEEFDWKFAKKRMKLSQAIGYINDMAYSTTLGIYVAVGNSGVIMTSVDGNDWEWQVSGTGYNLNGITMSGTTILVCGDNGTILTSSDATAWTSRTSGVSKNLYGITCNSTTLIVTVGDVGTVLTCPDAGVTWTARTSGVTTTLRGCSYGGSVYLAVGNSSTILSSADASTWTARTSGTTEHLKRSIYGNSLHVACGEGGTLLSSSNGTTWASVTSGTTEDLYGLGYKATTYYYAVGDTGTILFSADGATWATQDATVEDDLRAVVVGREAISTGDGVVLRTDDYSTWEEVDIIPYGWDYAYITPGTCLRIVATSTDGKEYDSDQSKWEREGNLIFCNEDEFYLEYIQQVTDTRKFPTYFCELMGSRIAVELCEKFVRQTSMKEVLWREYNANLLKAKEKDGGYHFGHDELTNAELWVNNG